MLAVFVAGYLVLGAIYGHRLHLETFGLDQNGRPRRFGALLSIILGLFWPLIALCDLLLVLFLVVATFLQAYFAWIARKLGKAHTP